MSTLKTNNIEHLDATSPSIEVNAAGGIQVGGALTATTGTFSGNVSIAGVLTYEDVTNIDSVGIITARNGIHVTSGSVGIGTDNPTSNLHLYNNGDATLFIQADADNVDEDHNPKISMSQDGGTSSYFDIGITGSAGGEFTDALSNTAYIKSVSNATTNGIQFATNGVARMYLNNDGYIGIGTDNPTKSLNILSPQSVMLQLESTSSTSRIGFKVPNTGSSPTIGITEEETLEFRAGAAERLRISSNGHIGAGTTLGLYGPGQLIVQSSSDLGYRLSRNANRNVLEFIVETAGTAVENHFSVDVPNKNIIIYIMMDYVGSRQSSSDAGLSRIGFENYVITRREDNNVVFTSDVASQNFEVAGPDAGGANDKQAINPFMQRTGTEAATETQQVEVQVQPRCSNGSNGWVTSHVKMIINGTIDANDFRVIID